MPAKTLLFVNSSLRSAPQQHDTHRSNPGPSNGGVTLRSNNNSSNSGHYHNSNSYHRQNGRGYGNYSNRYDGEISAARHLHHEISQNHQRYKGVQVFPANAVATTVAPNDRQEISEPATIVWSEGGIGEVMSPTVWRNARLHLYFDATKTQLEMNDGWAGLRGELEEGMELDVTFSLTNAQMQQLQQGGGAATTAAAAAAADTHWFICIEKMAEPSVAKSQFRTSEQAVVIAKRAVSGAAFLINNSGERTVLHPNFLTLDAVKDAILEKTQGPKKLECGELDSPSALCVLGRSLSVKLAPAPAWLPNIYPTDRGVTRWVLAAEPYGEEKEGRAVVTKSSRHSISLFPVEGDLARRRTTLHAPTIQMNAQLKRDVQQLGSVWRFRACRELPGRTAVWRAFELMPELDTDAPISEAVIDSIMTGNRLIELDEMEEEVVIDEEEERKKREKERREKESLMADLAQLFGTTAQQLQQQQEGAATGAADAAGGEQPGDNVQQGAEPAAAAEELVFESIDDWLESETFVEDVMRPPSILPREWELLGVPPDEAAKNEQEALLIPRVPATPRVFGVYENDERPDMRVVVQPKRKRKKLARPVSRVEEEEEEEEEEEREREREEERKGTAESKKERKEDERVKKHLQSVEVKFAAADMDMFDLLHGCSTSSSSGPAAAATAAAPAADKSAAPAATSAAAAAAVEEVEQDSSTLYISRSADAPATTQKNQETAQAGTSQTRESKDDPKDQDQDPKDQDQHPKDQDVGSGPGPREKIYLGVDTRTERSWRGEREEERRREIDKETMVVGERITVVIAQPPRGWKKRMMEAYPERQRWEGGWWFRPTRPRPPPEPRMKKDSYWRREERRRGSVEHSDDDDDDWSDERAEPEAAPFVPVQRPPMDSLRAKLLGGLKKPLLTSTVPSLREEKKEEKPVLPMLEVVTKPAAKQELLFDENVLVDLSPTSESAAAAASPAPLLQTLQPLRPTVLHDLKDLF